MLLQEKKAQGVGQGASADQMLDCLQAEMDARGIVGRIARARVRERQESSYCFVLVPVFVEDADDASRTRVSLERAWNEREPAPEKRLFLYPGGAPDGVI